MGESGCLSTTQMGKVPDYVRIILVERNAQVVKYVQRYTILFWQDLYITNSVSWTFICRR
jgi:hypothetical protein